jgi:copper homeostasis protein
LENPLRFSGGQDYHKREVRDEVDERKSKFEIWIRGAELQMNRSFLVEISVESVERAVAAERGGASRIELCASLEVGGVTPSVELMRETRACVGVPIFTMVRPREGDFVYSKEEFAQMSASIQAVRDAGLDGVVLGILRRDGRVDVERTSELVRAAAPLPTTFHRAFDESASLIDALEDVVATGVNRLLTSGGAGTAPEASKRIAALVREARGRVIVMPGSGITAENVGELATTTNATEFHAGLSSVVARDVGGSDFEREVRRLVEAIRRAGVTKVSR